uniref:Uncharacterized protein n=1 Tax=viral metagenome TaxID=1070528 RepID=A0A6M3ISQ7_9ZZZZ
MTPDQISILTEMNNDLISKAAKALAENEILKLRVKVLEEMLFGKKSLAEEEAIGTMKYGEGAN